MSQLHDTPKLDRDSIIHAMSVLVEPGQVVQLRALSVSGSGRSYSHSCSGYFDDPRALGKAAADITRRAEGMYITLNPISPALLARAANELKIAVRGSSASDANVLARRRVAGSGLRKW